LVSRKQKKVFLHPGHTGPLDHRVPRRTVGESPCCERMGDKSSTVNWHKRADGERKEKKVDV